MTKTTRERLAPILEMLVERWRGVSALDPMDDGITLEDLAVRAGLLRNETAHVICGGLSVRAAAELRREAAASGWMTDDVSRFRMWRQAANVVLIARDLGIVDNAYCEPLFAPGQLPAGRHVE
jgi:hypothetical protein